MLGAETGLGNLTVIIGAAMGQVSHQRRDGLGEALHVAYGRGPAVAESSVSDIAHARARARNKGKSTCQRLENDNRPACLVTGGHEKSVQGMVGRA